MDDQLIAAITKVKNIESRIWETGRLDIQDHLAYKTYTHEVLIRDIDVDNLHTAVAQLVTETRRAGGTI